MKRLGLISAVTVWAGVAMAQVTTNSYTFNVNQSVPDGSASGLAFSTNLGGIYGTIQNVTVGLDISGGYNGDLYAYLAGPNGGFAVLLNRVGTTNGNAFGYSDSGFNITLDDSGGNNNVHFYQLILNPNGGALTGTWGSDGENVDPNGGLTGTAASTATLASMDGTDPNGTWTLYIADLSGGGQSTLLNWTLNITAVPEPGTWAMGIAGGLILFGFARRFSRSN